VLLEAVVVKCPQWGLSPGEEAEVTVEIKHEAEMLARLSHPNIIPLSGVGTVPLRDGTSVAFLAVPLLAGVLSERLGGASAAAAVSNDTSNRQDAAIALSTLAYRNAELPLGAVLPKGVVSGKSGGALPPLAASGKKLALANVLRIAEELASALRYLHDEADQSGVILHRDLKPDNVGFNFEDSVMLFDFGLVTSIPRAALPKPQLAMPPLVAPSGGSGGGGAAAGSVFPAPLKKAASAGSGSSVLGSPLKPSTKVGGIFSSPPAGSVGGLPSLAPASDQKSGAVGPAPYRLPKYRLTGHTGSVRYMAPEVTPRTIT
jgi:serine/threonine protein kinase